MKKRVDKPTILHLQAAKFPLDISYKLLESEDKTPPKWDFGQRYLIAVRKRMKKADRNFWMSYPVTKEDIEQSRWQTFIADATECKCLDYSPLFSKKVEKAKESGDIRASRVFGLLLAIAQAGQRLDSDIQRRFLTIEGGALDYPFSYVEVNRTVLEEIVYEISDPEIRARIADLIWTLKVYNRDASRDYRLVILAIESYLKAARLLEEHECWRGLVRRLKHAVHLAKSFIQPALATEALDYTQLLLDTYADLSSSFPFAETMEILLQYKAGDAIRNAALAEREALRAREEGRWRDARRYWEVKAAWHQTENDDDKRLESQRFAAETFVNEAEDAATGQPPSHFKATVFLDDAITGLEQSGGSKERIEELKSKRALYQAKMPSELKRIEVSEDISDYVVAARELVKGKSFLEAIYHLAFVVAPFKDGLEEDWKEGSETTFRDLVSVRRLNKEGKTVGIRPPTLSNDADERRRAQKAKMLDQARLYQGICTSAFIEPARKQINVEHSIQVKDILPIVIDNPFVPHGREIIFARGLHAGLMGDFLVSDHLLIPQLENSLRYLLTQHGFLVTGDKQRIQYERPLGTILSDDPFAPKLKEILGEDILFDLQGLIGEGGVNLRNRISHGLMDVEEFDVAQMTQISYLWWLILRLCISFKFSPLLEE